MLPFHDVVRDDFDAVNRLIINQLHSEVGLVENIGQYIVDAGGKRLRPLMVLLAARACGYSGQDHIALAAIIEFIHTATLLHDDVVDTSDLRRGRPTANAKWGNAPSVLVGDFLYSRSFQMMVALNNMAVMRILADTTNVISEGEVQQLINAGNDQICEDDYYSVIDKKTARLFRAATEVGAVLAGVDDRTREQLAAYGHHLGMVFQLTDDVLDYQGQAEEIGKNLGDDLAEGKPTLPLIHILKTGSPEQVALISQVIRDGGREHFDAVIDAIKNTGAMDYTLTVAAQHRDKALNHLQDLPESKEKQALTDIVQFAFTRTF
jgi:octaprenyl-diphosphate synthase